MSQPEVKLLQPATLSTTRLHPNRLRRYAFAKKTFPERLSNESGTTKIAFEFIFGS